MSNETFESRARRLLGAYSTGGLQTLLEATKNADPEEKRSNADFEIWERVLQEILEDRTSPGTGGTRSN